MLEHIAKILKQLNDELKLDNDKWVEQMSQQQFYDQVMMQQHQQHQQKQQEKDEL